MTTSGDKTITIALMDPPYESGTTTTALRVVDAALRKGINVNVFAYEGAVNMTMKAQAAHPNPVKGTSIEEQDHPSSSRFIAGLFELAGPGPSSTGSTAASASTNAAPATGSRVLVAAAPETSSRCLRRAPTP